MKWLKKLGILLLLICSSCVASVVIYLYSTSPQYNGEVALNCVKTEIKVEFDDHGIPHIQAENKLDLMRAFGYLHAQDRLFQMELMRRVGGGTLSEIIGKDGVKADLLFRTMGLPQYARRKAATLLSTETDSAYVKELMAYLEGVNEFAMNGPTPPEFKLLGIDRHTYTLEDVFYIIGALGYNFSMAPKTEPVMDFVARKYGMDYLKDLAIYHDSRESSIPNTGFKNPASLNEGLLDFAELSNDVGTMLPVAPLNGSNAWALDGNLTASHRPLFCNDTHIGYMMPQTWYEAYLTCPGFEMYGHFLAGVPFALIGRNSHLTWGVTMLLNDDMDYFIEQYNPINENEIKIGAQFYHIEKWEEVMHVKGSADTTIVLQRTPHGPIINTLHKKEKWTNPISLHWTYTEREANPVWGFWKMNQSEALPDFTVGLSHIHSPGISINYADDQNNIAWFATAHLKKRPADWNPWILLDGTDPRSLQWEYFEFKDNPHSINPENHFIYSANDWPGPIKTDTGNIWIPGYYKPQYRADRICSLIKSQQNWTQDGMQDILNDVTNPMDAQIWKLIMDDCPSDLRAKLTPEAIEWKGDYLPEGTGPTIFNTLLYYVLKNALQDEMEPGRFQLFLESHQMQRAYSQLISNAHSPWWDNVATAQKAENRKEIIAAAWNQSWKVLQREYGDNPSEWKWKHAAQLQIQHPLGKVAVLAPFLNLEQHPVYGGNETIHQSGFYLDSTAHFKVFFGSQMRIVVDFQDVRNGLNITPSGQSGHFLSPFYDDQAKEYEHQSFRRQSMHMEKFENGKSLIIRPVHNN